MLRDKPFPSNECWKNYKNYMKNEGHLNLSLFFFVSIPTLHRVFSLIRKCWDTNRMLSCNFVNMTIQVEFFFRFDLNMTNLYLTKSGPIQTNLNLIWKHSLGSVKKAEYSSILSRLFTLTKRSNMQSVDGGGFYNGCQ